MNGKHAPYGTIASWRERMGDGAKARVGEYCCPARVRASQLAGRSVGCPAGHRLMGPTETLEAHGLAAYSSMFIPAQPITEAKARRLVRL